MPQWKRKIKIKHLLSDEESPEVAAKVASEIAKILTTLNAVMNDDWLAALTEDFELIDAFDEDPLEAVNHALDKLYDWGDQKRVWIG